MGQERITQQFFEYPTKNFQIRGLARELHLPKTTVSYHINQLLKKGMIIKEEKGIFPSFRANETSEIYLFDKKHNFLEKLIKSGLLDYIENETNPKCIILFGSFSKGEYGKESDIDFFVQSEETVLNLRKYEKIFGHKINVFFETDTKKISSELLNNIVNGIKLRGFLKLR